MEAVRQCRAVTVNCIDVDHFADVLGDYARSNSLETLTARRTHSGRYLVSPSNASFFHSKKKWKNLLMPYTYAQVFVEEKKFYWLFFIITLPHLML